MQVVRPSVVTSLLARNAACLSRAYHAPAGYRVATLNDLPKPEGDWQEANKKKQFKYNVVLAAGILFFGATVSIIKEAHLIHFNFSPPKTYE